MFETRTLLSGISCLLLASSALASGKGFSDGLSRDEVTRLTKSLGAMEAKYDEAKPAMDKLKKSPEIRKNAKLTAAASDVLKSYTTVGVFINEMEAGLKKRDPKVNSYELKLKGEVDTLELKLAALTEQAKMSQSPSVVEIVVGAVVIAAALDTLYVAFDSYYDVALADVDLVLIPAYDVYDVVHYESPYLVVYPDVDDGTDVAEVVEGD